jgi:hypothetical protein
VRSDAPSGHDSEAPPPDRKDDDVPETGPDDYLRLPSEAISTWLLTPGEDTPGRQAKHDLVAHVRTLINAVTMLAVSDLDGVGLAAVANLTAQVQGTVEGLGRLPQLPGGPSDAGGDDARLLERSGITGQSNPLSPPLHLTLSKERVDGWAEYPQQYEGPPGCVHGGFVAAAFDDLLGAAQMLSGGAGFTANLNIQMLRPTPLGRRIDYEAGLESVDGRKIWVWGKSRHGDTLLAEARGLFVSPRPDSDHPLARKMGGRPPWEQQA